MISNKITDLNVPNRNSVLLQHKNSKDLDLKFDLACENYAYAKYQKERLCLHETKCRYENNHVVNGSNYDVEAMVSKPLI